MGLVVFESGISIDLIWIVIPQDAAERTLREGVGWCLRVSRTRGNIHNFYLMSYIKT